MFLHIFIKKRFLRIKKYDLYICLETLLGKTILSTYFLYIYLIKINMVQFTDFGEISHTP